MDVHFHVDVYVQHMHVHLYVHVDAREDACIVRRCKSSADDRRFFIYASPLRHQSLAIMI